MTTYTMTPGATYTVTYYTAPGHTGKTATKTPLKLTTVLYGGTKKATYIFHGPKGGKVVLGATAIVAAVPA